MRWTSVCGIGSLCIAILAASTVVAQDPNKKVLMLVANKDALAAFDPALKLRLEWQHAAEVTVEQADAFDATGLGELAQEHNLVLISETLGSGSTLQDGAFKLQATPVPVISFEAYMWEDAFWTDVPQFAKFGNTGRTDLIEEPLADGLDQTQTDFYITAAGAAHPMGAGFAEGAVTIHTQPYSVNFGTPSADATVIATADSAGKWPSHYVYDEGDTLVDGSTAPATRIAAFIGQAANPNANFAPQPEFFNENALALIDAMFEYTLGPMPTPGDVDLDGDVDLTDFESIRGEFLTEGMTRADVNHDMFVDFTDFGLWKVNSQIPAPAQGPSVPEPNAFGMLALAALILSRSRCQARQR